MTGRVKRWIPALALAVAAACRGGSGLPTEPSVLVVGDTAFVQLPIGRSVTVEELSIRFAAVAEDSRCPLGVYCVWEGNARVDLEVSSGLEGGILSLNTNLTPREADFGGRRIALAGLSPYPSAGVRHRPQDYVASLTVVATP